jgi:hypothetical protein
MAKSTPPTLSEIALSTMLDCGGQRQDFHRNFASHGSVVKLNQTQVGTVSTLPKPMPPLLAQLAPSNPCAKAGGLCMSGALAIWPS